MPSWLALGLLFAGASSTSAATAPLDATWCGKYYQPDSPTTAPSADSFFSPPTVSASPLLNFACAQAVRPYVFGDASASIVVDAAINYQLGTAWSGDSSADLSVSITVGGKSVVKNVSLAPNTTGTLLTFDLSELKPQTDAFVMSCTATVGGRSYAASSTLLYLPKNPNGGSVVKMDKQTGGILVPNSVGTAWEPLFPLGFFTDFTYLSGNLSALDEMKAMGINVVHPIPPFDNAKSLKAVLDHMEELGLWLMYDMRYSYSNATARSTEVNAIKGRSNLLLWYTGDEADGSADPIAATTEAYDAIMTADGYHPISLVLNCADYKWTDYSSGADIIMQDAYPLFTNVSFSSLYDTACSTTFGCCGCDNCKGDLSDISTRIDSYYERIHLTGRDRNATVWSTFQAFSGDFWPQYPTGDEILAMSVLSITRGSTGIISWQAPTTADILAATATLGAVLSTINPFTLSTHSTRAYPTSSSSVSATLWTQNTTSLLLLANIANSSLSTTITALPNGVSNVKQFLGGASGDLTKETVSLGPFGVGGWTFDHEAVASPAAASSGTKSGASATATSAVDRNALGWGLGMCATGLAAGMVCW